MNYILLQKQESIFTTTESVDQYPNIIAQTSDKIKSLEKCENSAVVFDDILLLKQERNFDLLLQEDGTVTSIFSFFFKALFLSP